MNILTKPYEKFSDSQIKETDINELEKLLKEAEKNNYEPMMYKGYPFDDYGDAIRLYRRIKSGKNEERELTKFGEIIFFFIFFLIFMGISILIGKFVIFIVKSILSCF